MQWSRCETLTTGVGVKPECSGAGCHVLKDSSSRVERLNILSGRESESVVVLACLCADGSRSRRPRCEASKGSR
ncbi:hypothetical protein CDL15_Pgr008075 [Punica granatum]|uniref:Uncharacterized protein n=1 Tax=Punica granatum TaxID=22663 RepID=A0A218WMA4_PUNGR|nr:hypothetical protein CDL15_Pgr008075 [Punica granatum]